VLLIVLDCVYVDVFISKGLYPTAALYADGAAGKPNRTRIWPPHVELGAVCARVLLYYRNMHAIHLIASLTPCVLHRQFAA